MITWLLFETRPGQSLLAWLENHLNLAVITRPHFHLVDATLLAHQQAPLPRHPTRYIGEERRDAAQT